MKLDNRETATVLAALRYWQRCGDFAGDDIQDIASDSETFNPLSDTEVDELCERINC